MRAWIAGVLGLALGPGCTIGGRVADDSLRCDDGRLVRGDASVVVQDCRAEEKRCDGDAGCVGCVPGAARCEGSSVARCAEDGETWRIDSACSATETCSGGACVDACALAESARSYAGCVYDAVSTPNPQLGAGFDFGVVLGNTSDAPAEVRITRGGDAITTLVVPPRSARSVRLPLVDAIARLSRSALVSSGAYRIEASRPIAAYQYNPLAFRRDDTCAFTGTSRDSECFSFTNDASLLLPIAALGTEHLVEMPASIVPFVTIVAHAPSHLAIVASADLASSEDGRVPAHTAGERFEVELAADEVLTLVAAAPSEASLAGTVVTSDAPVLVIAGAGCANVPAGSSWCDHLEEVMLPVESWGRAALAAAPRAVEGEPFLLRVTSAVDGNAITLSGVARAIPLDRGEVFETIATRDLVVRGAGPILVTQYLVGARYFDRGLDSALGDPSMGVAPFVEQLRTSHGFAAPDTYTSNFAAIVTRDPERVRLDGEPIAEWDAIDGEPWFVARVAIASGAHVLDAPTGAGLTLYGLAPYTSYLLPGGLDVEPLR